MKETLEEATTRYAEGKSSSSVFQKAHIEDFIAGVEWQQERMYSEEDMREAYMVGKHGGTTQTYYDFDRWFEQFKNK
jgi:hypothetical protein